MADRDAVQVAKNLLKSEGYVVLREKSYRQAQERQRVAEAGKQYEIERRKSSEHWAFACLDERDRLSERCDDLIAFAYEHGATTDDLVRFNDRLIAARAAAQQPQRSGTPTETGGER